MNRRSIFTRLAAGAAALLGIHQVKAKPAQEFGKMYCL